ncbi:thioredoxin family protein [Zobellia amurskyensis]|uniref:Thioredoxin family protein n=1 Tax=Zobellia amurskyensis TaxID=248905 RepID=A0A7X3D379_9FLAO|nr:thioredoxin family protein [Zobellia amurskyensis]MUH37876.1 thioredoxin family protein [Zobellia amurskyensis]
MKKLFILFFLMLATSLSAQQWGENFADVLALAKKDDKTILLVFSGSDWCAPCIKLDKAIWQSEEFKQFSRQNLITYKADFPRKKANRLSDNLTEQNNKLAEKYNPQGHFPLVVLLDGNGGVLGQTGYLKLTPEAYVTHLKSFLE